MARVIGIDFCTVRTGLAVTDPAGIIASALGTVPSAGLIHHLKNYTSKDEVEGFVVGLPIHLDGRHTDATLAVLAFVEQLKGAFPDQWVETIYEFHGPADPAPERQGPHGQA